MALMLQFKKKLVTMEVKGKKKGSSAGNGICNTAELHSCVMCLLSVGQREDSQKIKHCQKINSRLKYREEMV